MPIRDQKEKKRTKGFFLRDEEEGTELGDFRTGCEQM